MKYILLGLGLVIGSGVLWALRRDDVRDRLGQRGLELFDAVDQATAEMQWRFHHARAKLHSAARTWRHRRGEQAA